MDRATTLSHLGPVMVRPGPLLELLEAGHENASQVVAALSRDPALSARVLGVTNSAWTGLRHPIRTIPRAVAYLGAGRARAVGLAFGVRALAEAGRLPGRMGESWWAASLQKACAARRIAAMLPEADGDNAFVCGLLQDVALPMLIALDPGFYREMVEGSFRDGEWCERERRRFGIDHGEAGAWVMERWGIRGGLLCEVRAHHSGPARCHECDGPGLPSFVAGLLPHLTEITSERQRGWLNAVHVRFLAEEFATPERFVLGCCADAAQMLGLPADRVAAEQPPPMSRYLDALAEQTIDTITQLHRIEHAIDTQRRDMSTLRIEAYTDPLCKCLNRRGFLRLGEVRLGTASAQNEGVCCMVLDLDGFKPINDRHGHTAGDRVLRGVAKMLRRCLDRGDLVGRLGGDEFAVLLTGVSESQAREVVDRLCQRCLGKQMRVAPGVETTMAFSQGAVHLSRIDPTIHMSRLLAWADETMYVRKHSQKNGACFVTRQIGGPINDWTSGQSPPPRAG